MKKIKLTDNQRKQAMKLLIMLLQEYYKKYGKKSVNNIIENKANAYDRIRWRRYFQLACEKIQKKGR